jgi:hypothetical protein
MQLQPEQRSRLLCRVIIFELSKFPFLSLSFLANFFEKGNMTFQRRGITKIVEVVLLKR